MSVKHPLMVVGTADRNIIVFNLQNPGAEFKRIQSPLKFQTRCIATFPDKQVSRSGQDTLLSLFIAYPVYVANERWGSNTISFAKEPAQLSNRRSFSPVCFRC